MLIYFSFFQVDYIIPILTREYIEMVNNLAKANEKIHNNLDTKYLKYIYSLLRYEYVANKCCNNRVRCVCTHIYLYCLIKYYLYSVAKINIFSPLIRCIVPDKDVCTVVRANLHPTLQAWFRESDIDGFVNNILLHKF